MQLATPQFTNSLPGEFAIRTRDIYFFTARSGGGQSDDAITTSATTVEPNEKFKLTRGSAGFWTIQTLRGYYLSATGGSSDDLHSLQTDLLHDQRDNALFRLVPFRGFPFRYSIQTFSGHYVTALDGGGRSTAAFHTDARKVSTWETFDFVKCGDLGTGYKYWIRPDAGIPFNGFHRNLYLAAIGGGGRIKGAIGMLGGPSSSLEINNQMRFQLLRQADGSYAIKTSNGYYVTAQGGGGLASPNSDNLQTNRTQVQAWEKFRIVDQGNCLYTIQTSGNWYLGYQMNKGVSTRISFPDEAPQIGYVAKWELVMDGL